MSKECRPCILSSKESSALGHAATRAATGAHEHALTKVSSEPVMMWRPRLSKAMQYTANWWPRIDCRCCTRRARSGGGSRRRALRRAMLPCRDRSCSFWNCDLVWCGGRSHGGSGGGGAAAATDCTTLAAPAHTQQRSKTGGDACEMPIQADCMMTQCHAAVCTILHEHQSQKPIRTHDDAPPGCSRLLRLPIPSAAFCARVWCSS